MPFCVQCGNQVGDRDQFCARCGSRQGAPGDAAEPAPAAGTDFWSNLSPRNAALLCYIPWIGWIAAIAVLASARFREDHRMRFHAFQGLYIFVAWLMVSWVIQPFVGFSRFTINDGFGGFYQVVPRLLHLLVLAAWIFMMIKVHNDEDYRLPVLGELAERSVSEQRL